jgi:transcription antitermination protein NusB
MAGGRKKAREFALQMLFQWEMRREPVAEIEKTFWREVHAVKANRDFANHAFEGAAGIAKEIDVLLEKHSADWRVERMAAVDRAILRLAIWELRGMGTPPAVVINEAVELAKKYSSEDSSAFVNGILGAILKQEQAEGAASS